MTQVALQFIHIVAAIVVLFEALNKLERTAPFAPGLTARERIVDGLKALAWVLLALGSGAALVGPFMALFGVRLTYISRLITQYGSLAEVCVMAGFAVLIVRTRIKEG